ncbi:MAG: DUF1836 domain-containing protein [Lachnospiraceae bacterium]|nr:DUF1836 domain-containing protein [Lachnospiraceae bacterium]
MNQANTKLLADILRNIARTPHIRPGEVPDIDLYMDQVTTFMDEHLSSTRRYQDDKILTKTMINNYTKKKLLPHPTKKKYSKEHLLLLIFIYYLKDFLPLTDIRAILSPITERFFEADDSISIENIYAEAYELSEEWVNNICRDIMESWHAASNSFEDCPDEDRETLQIFSFICMLSFDIYLKKQVIEQMLDGLGTTEASEKTTEDTPDTPEESAPLS